MLASKRMPRRAFPLGTFRVKRVTALNFLPDFYLAGALRTAGLLVDERPHGQQARGGDCGDGPFEASSSVVLERYRAVGRGAGSRRLLCLLVSPSYEMQRWIADHLPHAWTVFLSHPDEVGDAVASMLPVLRARAGERGGGTGKQAEEVCAGERRDDIVSQTRSYIQQLEKSTRQASMSVGYRAESIAMCTGVPAETVTALLDRCGNSVRRLAATSTLSLRERFQVSRAHAEALADFFSAVEVVPPMIVYEQDRAAAGEPSKANEESESDA